MEKTGNGTVTTYWFKDGTSDFAVEHIEDTRQVSLQMLHDCGGSVDIELPDLIQMCAELAYKVRLPAAASKLEQALFLAENGR